MKNSLRVLFVVHECNPEWSSLPGFAYQWYAALRQRAKVTLVTHGRNRQALQRVADTRQIIFINESAAAASYYRAVARIANRGRVRWNLLSFLSYPVYAEFDARVFRRLHRAVENGDYDVVHAFTPIQARYPYKIAKACRRTPFLLGPVNGGLPYPVAFKDVARAESDRFNRLRGLASWLPGYQRTYARADKVLCGSTYTVQALQEQMQFKPDKFTLMYENGVAPESFELSRRAATGRFRLLFVGRLVPCKGVDMLLHALSQLEAKRPGRFQLTIVGDGEERAALERLATKLGVGEKVNFAGWVPHRETSLYYGNADVFCFPSIREFGGAVVLEAMAAGLPCLVAGYGGPAEYVTPQTGFALSVASREQLVSELIARIDELASDAALRSKMAEAAVARAREFTWDCKAARLVEVYHDLLRKYPAAPSVRYDPTRG